MFAWSLDSRAKALKRQQRKQNKLIHKMLPKVVVEKLKSGQDVIETFDSASIFFSSVVAFKDITRACTAFQVGFFILSTSSPPFILRAIRGSICRGPSVRNGLNLPLIPI